MLKKKGKPRKGKRKKKSNLSSLLKGEFFGVSLSGFIFCKCISLQAFLHCNL
ncbi:hypothetical protein ACMBCN_02670 [Candidatus Liberibacter asiaticus]|nr:hypothetical protein [Candidatus Liberibacter asiaticus]